MDGLDQDRRFLQALCKFERLPPSRLAIDAGLAATTILRSFNGTATTRLSAPTLDKLRAKYPDFPGWADYATGPGGVSDVRSGYKPADPGVGTGRLLPRELPSTKRNSPLAGVGKDDLVEVAGIDLNFGLGAAFMDEEVLEHQVERMQFPRSWLRSITTSPSDQLYWTRGVGNSMEPTIGDGDVILIDRSKVGANFGDLCWAIAYGQTGMVKRLRPMPDGSVKILSDNPAIPAEVAYDGELHIFGRVVAVVRKI